MSEALQYFKKQAAMIDEVMRRDLTDVADPDLSRVLADALFAGGKRIRPLLHLLAAAATRDCEVADLDRGHFDVAIAFEYLHVASLVHDDIIDSSETRRGRPAVWRAHSEAAAILAGDHLHARAMTLAGTAGGPETLAVIGAATQAMVESEFLQMRVAGRIDTGEEQYLAILRGKTAALISAACETGVIVAGGSVEQRRAMADYGAALGLAFQMQDDLLDYLGDPAKTGKAVGNDFLEAKMTMPVIHAIAEGGKEEREWLSRILAASREQRQEQFDTARDLLDRLGSFVYTRKRGEGLVNTARGVLSLFSGHPAAAVLEGLALYVIERDR